MNLVLELENVVRVSGAYTNEFFKQCNVKQLTKSKLREIVINFFPITQSFALSGFAYCDTVCKLIENKNYNNSIIKENNLEDFLAKVIEIISDEFNINHINKSENFHYNVFSRLAKKLDIKSEKLKNGEYSVHQETFDLASNLTRNFRSGSIVGGLANIFVIEYTAINIINCLWDCFAVQKDTYDNPLFNEYELEHITLHQILEIGHNYEAHQLFNFINCDKNTVNELNALCSELSGNLGKYWMRLLLDEE